MLGFLKRIVDERPAKGSLERLVWDDFTEILQIDPKLVPAAVAFVIEGETDERLRILAETQTRSSSFRRDDQPILAQTHQARMRFFLEEADRDPALTLRYARALALSGGRVSPHALATKLDPRTVLGMILWRAHEHAAAEGWSRVGFTMETLFDLVERAGGTPETAIAAFRLSFQQRTNALKGPDAKLHDAMGVRNALLRRPTLPVTTLRADPSQSGGLLHLFMHFDMPLGEEVVRTLVEQAGLPQSKGGHSAAQSLKYFSQDFLEPKLIDLLAEKAAKVREQAVIRLIDIGTENAWAALDAHLQTEKAASVRRPIETAKAGTKMQKSDARPDDATGYTALGGAWVEIPPMKAFVPADRPVFGPEDRAKLKSLAHRHYEAAKAEYDARIARGRKATLDLADPSLSDALIDYLNGQADRREWREDRQFYWMVQRGIGADWMRTAMARLPQRDGVAEYARTLTSQKLYHLPNEGAVACSAGYQAYLASDNVDLRQVHALALELCRAGLLSENEVNASVWVKELLGGWARVLPGDLPDIAVWPFLASNLDVLERLLQATQTNVPHELILAHLETFPATPQRLGPALLRIAMTGKRDAKAGARRLLDRAPGLDDRLIALLSDPVQETRAEAALWLGRRRAIVTASALQNRLKQEKSDVARAAMLTALRDMGTDISAIAGPAALMAEAEKTAKKVSLDKLGWLRLETLPMLRWADGSDVPPVVLRAWLGLAVKLKQPGGNGLFDLYLEQIAEEDRVRLGTWLFDAWIDYDTVQGDVERNPGKPWSYTERGYPNSGAETKGILALAKGVPAGHAAQRVRWFLKSHGRRTAQSIALLEFLASKGDPMSLQVVIAAAARLKQKGVQKQAGELVARIAEARDWSTDELADRTIATGGLDDGGRLELPVGEGARLYTARLDEALKLTLFNPEGKAIKALPQGDDEVTAESKKALAAAKKEVSQTVALQSDRLYDAMCLGRTWPLEGWQRDFRAHPLMVKLTERLVWLGLDANGTIKAIFRPTPEGDYINAADEAIELSGLSQIGLAHAALIGSEAAAAWEAHLGDYEVPALFPQFGRALMEPEDSNSLAIDDRQGWMTDAFTIRAIAKRLGYERGEVKDSGFFDEYVRRFPSAKLIAVFEFSGNNLPEENVAAAVHHFRFHRERAGRQGPQVRLGGVPPILLSECWHDYHAFAAKGAFDPDWRAKSPW